MDVFIAFARLLASTNHDDFPRQPQPEYRSQKDDGGWYSLIYAEGASNIAITGSGKSIFFVESSLQRL